jgi:hypothetical protein
MGKIPTRLIRLPWPEQEWLFWILGGRPVTGRLVYERNSISSWSVWEPIHNQIITSPSSTPITR